MLSTHLTAGRALGLMILGGIISTGVTLYISSLTRRAKRVAENLEDMESSFSQSGVTGKYGTDAQDGESENDFPPDFRIIIHGGAGVVSKGIDSKPFFDSLTRIMGEAYKFAKDRDNTATALDLAEHCVKLLEDDVLFNAGKGAVFTAYETIEMEASIMDGRTLECGAVSLIKTVKHPISLARAVMELTKHNHLVGKAAEKLAVKADLEVVDPVYFSTPKRREQLKRAKEMGDAVVNDHDYEEGDVDEGYSTDGSSPLRDPGTGNSDHKNENDCDEDLLVPSHGDIKLSPLQRMFLSEDSSPDSGSGITVLTGNGINVDTEISDCETTAYDKKMTKKIHNISEKYNTTDDLNELEKKEKVEVIEMLQGNEKEKKKEKEKEKEVGKSKNALEREREREKEKLLESFYPGSTGTVGCVCMFHGHVAAATSTGGLTNKMAGRVGDTSIIGAGTYANDNTCAVSATGKGEEFMRAVAAYDVSARMEIGKMSLKDAAKETVFKKLPAESGGIISITSSGEYSMEFNSKGMFRAVCDSTGKCSVGIWEDMIPFVVSPQGRPSIIVTGYSEKIEMSETPYGFDARDVRAALDQQ